MTAAGNTRPAESRFREYRFPSEFVIQAVRVQQRFTLRIQDVDDLLAERGSTEAYEGVHLRSR